ncbi:MAG: SRPBCC domain-containing protein [bacterium]
MLKKILIALAVIVAGFIGFVAMQPSEYHVARTATISAPAAAIFAHVNDFHKWEAWSPYEKRDPAMKKTYEGAPAGTGAVYGWSGSNEVGEGRATIVESRPNELITIKLEFVKPFAGTNTAAFAFKPEGDQTAVTWSLTGNNNFISKAICLFVDMDKMVGGDYEQGLAQLKSVVESASKKDLTITRIFDAPRELVWSAWTDSEHVKRWWGPTGFTAPIAKMEVREGGTSLVCMRSPEGQDFYNTWTYQKITPMEHLEFILDWADKDGIRIDPVKMGMPPDMPRYVRHVITFKAVGDNKTEMTVTEYGYTSDQMFDLSKAGLEQCLDKMAASFARS